MLSKMSRVQVLGSRRVLEPVVRRLHDLGMVQIEDATARLDSSETFLRKGAPDTPEKARLETLLARVGGVLASLPPVTAVAPPVQLARPPASLDEVLGQLESACAEVAARRAALEAEAAGLQQYRMVVTHLSALLEGPVRLDGFETTVLVVHERHRVALDLIAAELEAITRGRSEVITADVGGDSAVALLIYDRRSAVAVRSLLHGEGLSEVGVPAEYVGLPFSEAFEEARARERDIAEELVRVADRLAGLAEAHRATLLGARAELSDRLDELTAQGSLAESAHVFVMEGWIPRRQLGRLRAALAEVSVATEVVEVEARDGELGSAPVLLENWPIVRPFELLMSILAPPRYGTIDPTPLVAVFFPLFFGLILGDVAYGLILLVASLAILRRPNLPLWVDQLCHIFVICSVPTIAFGFAYGELFGDLGEQIGIRPLIVDRMQALIPMLAFSVAIGVFQVALGLILGMVNGYLERKRREILDKAAMLVALVALFLVVGAAADLLPRGLLTPSVAALVVTLAVLIASVGIVGPLEVIGAVGNILSYSRLMAIGLSSVVLAEVANDLGGLTGSLLLGAIVAGLFHALNVALGVFSPSIQSMRLHYVEFFGKFYETGGERFHPFRRGDLDRLKAA